MKTTVNAHFRQMPTQEAQCGIDCALVAIDSRCDGADRKHQDLSQSMYDGQLSFAHGFARKPRIELMLRQCLAHLVTLKKKKSGC